MKAFRKGLQHSSLVFKFGCYLIRGMDKVKVATSVRKRAKQAREVKC